MYNLAKWGNPAQTIRTYRLKVDSTFYFGDVAGGAGQQALVPRGLNLSDLFDVVDEAALP